MSVANKLYDRSHGFVGDVSASNPPMLYVDGQFRRAFPSSAYEGRLNIHNNVGNCKVDLLSGNLPAGYSLAVDNINKQVVLKWPAYKVNTVDINNAGFGNGNDGNWDLGPGWSIVNTGPADPSDPLNTYEAKYADSYGLADITNNDYVPVTAGQSVTVNCDINLGGSRSDGRVLLKWYDSNKNYIGPSLGEELSDNGTWQHTSVTGSAPQNGFVRVCAHVNRQHDNKPCWVDNFTWNLVQGSVGASTITTMPLSLKVTDSARRTAIWSGTIDVAPPRICFLTLNNPRFNSSEDLFTTSTGTSGPSSNAYVCMFQGKYYAIVWGAVSGSMYFDVYTSTDFTNWVQGVRVPTTVNGALIYGVVATPTAIIVCSNWDGMYRSTDGVHWNLQYAASNIWSDDGLYYLNGVIMGSMSGGSQQKYSVDDGVTWRGIVGVSEQKAGCIMFNGKVTTLARSGTLLSYTPQTDTWTNIGNIVSKVGSPCNSMFQGPNGQILVSASGGLYYTTDLVNFTRISTNNSPAGGKLLSDGTALIANSNGISTYDGTTVVFKALKPPYHNSQNFFSLDENIS